MMNLEGLQTMMMHTAGGRAWDKACMQPELPARCYGITLSD